MTAIKFEDIRPDDTIAITMRVKVESITPSRNLEANGPMGKHTFTRGWLEGTEAEFTLVERPLPPEPPEGSVVIFRDGSNNLQAYRLWAPHLGWQHAGKSTPSGGRTWADLMQLHEGHERTVIEP